MFAIHNEYIDDISPKIICLQTYTCGHWGKSHEEGVTELKPTQSNFYIFYKNIINIKVNALLMELM